MVDPCSLNPEGFSGQLVEQAPPHLTQLPATPCDDPSWRLLEEGFTLAREHEIESLFAIGNGYVGSRGSLAEGSGLSAPATFVAGVFDPKPGSVPELIRTPDWTCLVAAIDGELLRLDRGHRLEHQRILDLRQGILWRLWRHQDEGGRIIQLRELRFVSLAKRNLLFQCVVITPENFSGWLSIDVALTGSALQTAGNGTVIAMAASRRIMNRAERWVPSLDQLEGRERIELKVGEPLRLDTAVALYTSRDSHDPRANALTQAERVIDDVSGAFHQHRDAWTARWEASDLRIDGDLPAQRALRFAIYHLLSAANPDDERVSIGARSLSGMAYKGHVFWDTDIFMLPFFTLTYPRAARALMMYRYHTLAAARARAARLGYRGALYAWESADTGDDVTPPFVLAPDGQVVRLLTGEQEQHISADIAYAAWHYWKITGDDQFLLNAGAEIIFETARFWTSRVAWEDDRRYHIRGVIGPDEYHENVDDNAYTNNMAQWNLELAGKIAELLAERWPEQWRAIARRLGIDASESRQWRKVARDLYTGFDEETGLFEQFRGYFKLEEIDLATMPRTAPMDVLLGRERVQGSKISKQADVVMLLHLLWEHLPESICKINFDYYEPRCGHGSSLSPAIHAAVAARLGDMARAERYFKQAAEIDLANNMGNAAGGVHIGALGGLWQAAVFGFGGLRICGDRPMHHAHLPENWRNLSMRYEWHGQWYDVTLPGADGNQNAVNAP